MLIIIIITTNFLCLSVGTVIQWIFYVWSERWCCSWTTLNCTDTVYIWLIHSGLHLLHAPFGQKEKKNNILWSIVDSLLWFRIPFCFVPGKIGRNAKSKCEESPCSGSRIVFASRWEYCFSRVRPESALIPFPAAIHLLYGNYGNSDLSSSRRFAVKREHLHNNTLQLCIRLH